MGRRSINTTKSGKYMNPTDQARKEARKKELKKNKKQRQMVRAAVLKGKDPAQIIMEMDKMDMIEFNVDTQAILSEKVLKEKRKKLRETLDRVLKLYEKENPEYWVQIRRMETEYEKKRLTRIEYYEAVRHAQAVTVEEIPLPCLDMPPLPGMGDKFTDQGFEAQLIPNVRLLPGHSILKKNLPSHLSSSEPPGCPPTLPVEFSESENEDEEMSDVRPKTIRFADTEATDDKDTRLTIKKPKLVAAGDDDEDDLDEGVGDQSTKQKRITFADEDEKEVGPKKSENLTSLQTKLLQMSGHGLNQTGGMLPGVPPPPLMLRPPPRPGMPVPPGVRMPPMPLPQGLLPRLPNMRLPPPMGVRPPMRPGLLLLGMPVRGPPPGINPNVLTAGPQLIVRPRDDDKKSSATIEAKPQIRNLSADVTRFLPTALRVKRDDRKRLTKLQEMRDISTKPEETDRRPTKDDAYSQFMKEMEDLL